MSTESLLGKLYGDVFRSLVTVGIQQAPLELQHLDTLERLCSQLRLMPQNPSTVSMPSGFLLCLSSSSPCHSHKQQHLPQVQMGRLVAWQQLPQQSPADVGIPSASLAFTLLDHIKCAGTPWDPVQSWSPTSRSVNLLLTRRKS